MTLLVNIGVGRGVPGRIDPDVLKRLDVDTMRRGREVDVEKGVLVETCGSRETVLVKSGSVNVQGRGWTKGCPRRVCKRIVSPGRGGGIHFVLRRESLGHINDQNNVEMSDLMSEVILLLQEITQVTKRES